MDIVGLRNIGALIRAAFASAFTSVTAGGTGDGTQVVGTIIDRLDPNTGSLANTVQFNLAWTTTLASAKTLSLKSITVMQNTANSTSGATALVAASTTFPDAVVATVSGSGVTSYALDVRGAQRFVYIEYTPKMSNTTTDTATVQATAVLAGYDRLPT